MVKEYIKASKDNKNKCKLLDIKSKSDESKQLEKSMKFLIDNIVRLIETLENEYTQDVKNADDQEIKKWYDNLSVNLKNF